ncbi:ferric reductase-like transmembrane domain-containing protein [Streptomyces sp. SL13]|uniref:Ferric reductase-like transmembrane domain-containing protein n=1 Tax=Streptantibioticus silvisoli TaxID=2705255 RepID=A0AA90HB31_9ACTN|nr:ferric reductase-like transmembrane domain-containing protein [Streptantibioticus silvisoli]MDI5974093.1 ferric reductase-like transmembrane domain-containing protein [Streptantibioticus silvisoli]
MTAAGRVSGLLAAYLLLVLVALMARVPWLENRVGSDVVARYHRALGEYTVALAVAHAALIILGYAWQSGADPLSETVTVVLDYPDVLLSAVSLVLLVLVGAVSARAVRRSVSYETWYHVHLLVYAAIGLAFAHEFAVGADFSASPRNRLLWSGAHIAVGLAVVGFRLVVPLRRSLRHRLRVVAVVEEGPGVVSIHLAGRDLGRLDARAGQFLRWRFLTRGHWWQSHPYSLSAAPGSDGWRITVKDLGDSSASLGRLRPGTRVWFEGPYGAFTEQRRSRARRVLLIAGGAGITPIRALYETLPGRDTDVILLYRGTHGRDLVLYQELEQIARHRGFGLYPLIGPRNGPEGDPLSSENIRRLVPDVAARDVYLCGPGGMTTAAGRHLRRAGVPRHRVHTEAFEF